MEELEAVPFRHQFVIRFERLGALVDLTKNLEKLVARSVFRAASPV